MRCANAEVDIPAWSGKRGHFNFEYYTLTLVEDETKHVRKGEIAFKVH